MDEKHFRFYTRVHLPELTGLRAYNMKELLDHIKSVPGSSIYYHTHRFIQQHQILSPEPPNDFAWWIAEAIGDDNLSERIASIDIVQFTSIRSLRERIIAVIEKYLEDNPSSGKRFAPEGEEFHFLKCMSFVFSTSYVAENLKDFMDILGKVTIDSIYFHMFESRLRLEKADNDFSYWITTQMNNKTLADKISALDPYTYTMEDLRKQLVKIVKKWGLDAKN